MCVFVVRSCEFDYQISMNGLIMYDVPKLIMETICGLTTIRGLHNRVDKLCVLYACVLREWRFSVHKIYF